MELLVLLPRFYPENPYFHLKLLPRFSSPKQLPRLILTNNAEQSPLCMNSTSNGQSSISDDGKPVPQTQLPAPPQQPPVPTNTDAMTVKLAKPLLAANFGAVISLVTSRLDGSRFHYLSSKLADAKSFDTVVACFAIGFTCNMHVMLLQKDSPIAARIGGYAGALSSVIGFLTMIQILLPPALLWIVWSAAVSIFLSFLYNLANNWFDTEDENVDTEGQNVDTEGENVLFYWGGEIVSDHEGVSYNCDAKKLCKVEKGTTLRQLKAMIKPEMALNEENVQLKFNYRIPRQQSSGLRYALAPINDDKTLNLVLDEPKRLSSILTLEFYVHSLKINFRETRLPGVGLSELFMKEAVQETISYILERFWEKT
ncbi:hypothetical protein TEA_015520 [Camellia sinensis var. sinensis]|uniref:Uncharacterized protein n=1 Tax=Camellia sinensis var. sinensis TaxID=542762 RepID=A0A4S4DYX8_CAMSN|nr:hypothetical protein TEA_015520 [Camellia sinensis var. sinensis]